MPLTGQAKKDYQKELMRKRRSNKPPQDVIPDVRPGEVPWRCQRLTHPAGCNSHGCDIGPGVTPYNVGTESLGGLNTGHCQHCGAVIDKKDNCCRPCFDAGRVTGSKTLPERVAREWAAQDAARLSEQALSGSDDPLKDYILRTTPGMPNLERLQRIAGSLGKRAGEVRFGITADSRTMGEIGKAIGTQPGRFAR